MNALKNSICLLAASVLVAFTTACSSDEKPEQPKVECALQQTGPVITYVSKGTFEIPIQLKGNTEAPKASDFAIQASTQTTESFRFDWDTTEEGEQFPTHQVKLSVSGVHEGEETGTYILTIDYDTSGYMDVRYSGIHLYYQNSETTQTFLFSCQTYAQQTIALPVHTLKKAEVPTTLRIEVETAYKQLGLSAEEIHATQGRYGLYGGTYGSEILEKSALKYEGKTIFLGCGYNEHQAPVVSLLGAQSIEPGITYFVQLVISLGQGNYAAIHIPILVTE